jgi:hypothetical protein
MLIHDLFAGAFTLGALLLATNAETAMPRQLLALSPAPFLPLQPASGE